MNEENKHIKRGLENLTSYEPKPELWEAIEAGLEEDSKPKIIYWRWLTGIAAMIAISFTLNWFAKENVDTPIVEVNEPVGNEPTQSTTLADSQILEVNMPVPEKLPMIHKEVPTTGPYDGKAGEALRNPSYRDKEFIDEAIPTVPDTLTQGDMLTYTITATDANATTWNFGNSTVQQGTFAYSFTAPATTNLYSVDVKNVVTSEDLSLNYTIDQSVGSDVTLYEEADNIGFVESDGVAVLVEKDALTKDATQKTLSASDIEQLPTRSSDNAVVGSVSNSGIRSSESTVGRLKSANVLRSKRKFEDKKFKAVGNTSNIEVPFVRVPEKEKYQCVIPDSISGFYSGRNDYKPEPINTESYFPLIENEYLKPTQEPLSTFGIDVDNASYAVMRTKINANQIVPKDAVRVEEFINYFDYNYPEPTDDAPFTVNIENAECPWNTNHQLVRIGLKGKDINYNEMQNSNLVFLIDVSGSMNSENKLPLVKKSMKLLVDQMGPNDRIAIVTYAGAAGLALESTRCDEKDFIKRKIDKLDAGGSTAGGEGIKLAYKIAVENLIVNGNNRVIMCTDGDFNVGQSSDTYMKQLIINNRNKGIFITACGFGMGNYQDSKMETIADNGNGNYFYIDTYRESEKVFNREIRATLFTIAKDVKIQVEFNPKHVKAYRLIGYENRKMPPQDFNDDTKDGGELGAGHTVTALYEIIPTTSDEAVPGGIDLKYQTPSTTTNNDYGDELLTVKLRYKKPNGSTSMLLERSLNTGTNSFNEASEDFQFAAGVALYGQQLRQSKFIDQKDFTLASSIIEQSLGSDINGDRLELLTLIKKASKNYQVYTKE